MKEIYIIEVIGEKGTHYTVKKAFSTREKAERYASHIYGISSSMEVDKVQTISIAKLEIV